MLANSFFPSSSLVILGKEVLEGLLALGDDFTHFLLLEEALEGDLFGDGVLRFEIVHARASVAGLDCLEVLMLSFGTS